MQLGNKNLTYINASDLNASEVNASEVNANSVGARKKYAKGFVSGGRNLSHKGFTLFELVVSICTVAILYMVAEQRLSELPASAERASFYGVLEQIKTGVNFKMVSTLAAGGSSDVLRWEGRNPIEFLLQAPTNYQGEVERVTQKSAQARAWYYESETGHLVYVVGGGSVDDVLVQAAGQSSKPGQIRFKLMNQYSSAADQNKIESDWQGVILQEVVEYNWPKRQTQPLALN
jgi:hypothetical protein